jgi:SAM-dependent methyltransferase
MKNGQNRLYKDLAYLWPLVSDPADYAKEAAFWREALTDKLGPGRHRILELGVGGGNNLSHLTGEFEATAVDLSPGMLKHSRKLNPDVEHIVGDMRTIRLKRKFDAVIIHDAIGYMISENDLSAAIQTAAVHLEPGGIFITAPDYLKETFPGIHISHNTSKTDDLDFAFIEYDYDSNPEDEQVEVLLIYIINSKGKLQIEHDHHVLGLFPKSTWKRLFEEAGFDFESRDYPAHEDHRQGYLFVGTLQR